MAASAALSASVTGSKLPPPDLSSTARAVRKKGRIAVPGDGSEVVHEGREIDGRHRDVPG